MCVCGTRSRDRIGRTDRLDTDKHKNKSRGEMSYFIFSFFLLRFKNMCGAAVVIVIVVIVVIVCYCYCCCYCCCCLCFCPTVTVDTKISEKEQRKRKEHNKVLRGLARRTGVKAKLGRDAILNLPRRCELEGTDYMQGRRSERVWDPEPSPDYVFYESSDQAREFVANMTAKDHQFVVNKRAFLSIRNTTAAEVLNDLRRRESVHEQSRANALLGDQVSDGDHHSFDEAGADDGVEDYTSENEWEEGDSSASDSEPEHVPTFAATMPTRRRRRVVECAEDEPNAIEFAQLQFGSEPAAIAFAQLQFVSDGTVADLVVMPLDSGPAQWVQLLLFWGMLAADQPDGEPATADFLICNVNVPYGVTLSAFCATHSITQFEAPLCVDVRTSVPTPELAEDECPVSSLSYRGLSYDRASHGDRDVTVHWYNRETGTRYRRPEQITLADAAAFGHPAAVGGLESWVCKNPGVKSSSYGAGQGIQLTSQQAADVELARTRVDNGDNGVFTLPSPGDPNPRFNATRDCAFLAVAIMIGATTSEMAMFRPLLKTSNLGSVQAVFNHHRKEFRDTSFGGWQLKKQSFDGQLEAAEIVKAFPEQVLLLALKLKDTPQVHVVGMNNCSKRTAVYDPAFPRVLSAEDFVMFLRARQIVEVRTLESPFAPRPNFREGAFLRRSTPSSRRRHRLIGPSKVCNARGAFAHS